MSRLIAVIAAVVVVVVVVGVAGAVFFLSRETTHESDETAKFLPDSTSVYVSFNLRPGPGQLIKLREILEAYEDIPDVEDAQREAFDFIEDEIPIDIEDDVLPWIGPEIAFGLIDFDADFEEPEFVAFLGTTDVDATENFLDELLDFIEDEEGLDFDRDTYESFTTYGAEPEFGGVGSYFALTDDYLVFATGERLLERTIDRILDSGNSLAENPLFIEAQSEMQDPRFASVYVNWDNISGTLESSLSDSDLEQFGDLEELLPTFTSASASFIDMGLKLTSSSDNPPSNTFFLPDGNNLDSAQFLPHDTIFMMSLFGFDKIWEEIERTIQEEADNFTDEFGDDSGIAGLGLMMGLNFAEDLFEWMTGEFTIALLDVETSGDDFEDSVVHLASLIDFEDRDDAGSALETLTDAVGFFGVTFEEEDLKGLEAMLADVEFIPGANQHQPGYLFHEERIAIGSTVESLEMTIDASRGDIDSLDESPIFSRVMNQMQGGEDFFIYVNIARVVDLIEDNLPPEEDAEYQENAAPFVDPLEAFLMGFDYGESRSTASVVLTLEQ